MSLLTSLLAPGNGANQMWVPAAAFTPRTGAVAMSGSAFSSTWPAMLYDAAVSEIAVAVAAPPAEWATYDLALYWTNPGAGAGDVYWKCDLTTLTAGGTAVGVGGVGTLNLAVAAPAQNVLKLNPAGTGIANETLLNITLNRRGDVAEDTLPNDAALVGFMLTKAS
jgi:hypothetical protein